MKNLLRVKKPARIPKPADKPIAYGVIGFEYDGKKRYYTAVQVFEKPLNALLARGAMKDLHEYRAFDEYWAVSIYANGVMAEIFYSTLQACYEQNYPLQGLHPALGYEFFAKLLAERQNVK